MITVELLNQAKFVHKLQQYQKESRKNMAKVINDKLGDVAVTAIGTTYRTNAAQIASELQRVVGKVVTQKVFKPVGFTKSGKIKKRKIGEFAVGYKAQAQSYVGTYKLVNWLLKNRGLPTLGKTKLGVGGLGMGTKPGTIGALAASVFGKTGGLVRGDYSKEAIMRLGGGTKADEKQAQIEGVIFNRAGDKDTRYYPPRKRAISGAAKVGMPGLELAISKVMRDMDKYLARKNKEASDKLKL